MTATTEPMPEAEIRCAGTRKDGSPCGVDPDLLLEDDEQPGVIHWCFNHHPAYEAERELARSRGGHSKAAKDRRSGSRFLTTHDLGDLETPADALRWSQVIAGSVVTGKLGSNAAAVALKALEAWVKAHEAVDLEARLAELETRVERTTRGGMV